jgi:hypothetical protein
MQVMLDSDLADLYGVETKVLNQAVKRNKNRFPERFMFMLSDEEKKELVTNCDRLSRLKHSSSNPYVFTEQGVAMLSTVLKSKTAIDVSIKIMDAFVSMRHFILENLKVSQRFDIIEKKQIEYQLESDKKFEIIFKAMESDQPLPKQGIFFDGQVFDAHKFVSDIVRSAEKSIFWT